MFNANAIETVYELYAGIVLVSIATTLMALAAMTTAFITILITLFIAWNLEYRRYVCITLMMALAIILMALATMAMAFITMLTTLVIAWVLECRT